LLALLGAHHILHVSRIRVNQNVNDGEGEKIRTFEAWSKVGTHRCAGKLDEVKCFTRKSTRDTEVRWETWGKGRFFCTNPLVFNIILCNGDTKQPLS